MYRRMSGFHTPNSSSTGWMTLRVTSSWIISCDTSSECWLLMTTASTPTGVMPSYFTLTCDLPSGRR